METYLVESVGAVSVPVKTGDTSASELSVSMTLWETTPALRGLALMEHASLLIIVRLLFAVRLAGTACLTETRSIYTAAGEIPRGYYESTTAVNDGVSVSVSRGSCSSVFLSSLRA